MLMTARRREIRARVLAACQTLIAAGKYPTAARLKALCPDRGPTVLGRLRDEFIELKEIDHTALWPLWAWEDSYADGPDPDVVAGWPEWTDEVVYAPGSEPGWRPRPKRKDARRRECEVRP